MLLIEDHYEASSGTHGIYYEGGRLVMLLWKMKPT
jgi:hypothetical protein